jgi:hypothetical protein
MPCQGQIYKVSFRSTLQLRASHIMQVQPLHGSRREGSPAVLMPAAAHQPRSLLLHLENVPEQQRSSACKQTPGCSQSAPGQDPCAAADLLFVLQLNTKLPTHLNRLQHSTLPDSPLALANALKRLKTCGSQNSGYCGSSSSHSSPPAWAHCRTGLLISAEALQLCSRHFVPRHFVL